MAAGGWSAEKQADEEVKALFEGDEMKTKLGEALGQAVQTIEVIAIKTQVVAGVNYKVKALVNGSETVFKAYKPLPHTGNPVQITGTGVDF